MAMTERAPAQTGREVEVVTKEGEVVSGLPATLNHDNQPLAVALARAEVDQQIATAQALPRSITRAVQNIMTLATIDEESAGECIYALPRAGKAIKGPSIRLAEIISSQWGNCRVGARVVHVDRYEKYVEAEGVFHDLETNTATTARVRRRISDKRGKLLNEDMIVVTGNAACSIAKRNAILGGVPKAVWRKAYHAVEQVLTGDAKTLSERRDKAMKAFAVFGVSPERIFASLGIAGLDDIGLEQIITLTGMHSALKNGEETVEDMFPQPQANGGDKPKGLGAALDELTSGGEKPAAEGNANGEAAQAPSAGAAEPQKEGEEQAAAKLAAADAKEAKPKGKPEAKAKPKALTDEDRTKLRTFADALAKAESPTTLQKASSAFYQANDLEEGTPFEQAANAIYTAHLNRVKEEIGASDADNAVKKVLA